MIPRTVKKPKDEITTTLLDHQFGAVILFIAMLFATLMALLFFDWKYSKQPICHSQAKLSDWVYNAMAMAAGCAILTCTLQTIRIASLIRSRSKLGNMSLIRVNIMLFVLSAISGISKMLILGRFGGCCADSFGVYSPAAQWVEWFVLVPLLNYIACAVEQKTRMDAFDIWMVSLLALMILCGYLLNVHWESMALHIFLLFLSFLCLVVVTAMTVYNHHVVFAHGIAKVRMSNYFSAKQTQRKATLLVYLLIIMWYYPIVWFLGAVQALDANLTYAAYMLGSIFGKVIFSSLVIESHVTLLYEFLITTAHTSNLGEEDRMVDMSVSIKKSSTSSFTFSALLRAASPKIVPVDGSADYIPRGGTGAGAGANAVSDEAAMSPKPEEIGDEVEEFPV